jgi:hypothetical protein
MSDYVTYRDGMEFKSSKELIDKLCNEANKKIEEGMSYNDAVHWILEELGIIQKSKDYWSDELVL